MKLIYGGEGGGWACNCRNPKRVRLLAHAANARVIWALGARRGGGCAAKGSRRRVSRDEKGRQDEWKAIRRAWWYRPDDINVALLYQYYAYFFSPWNVPQREKLSRTLRIELSPFRELRIFRGRRCFRLEFWKPGGGGKCCHCLAVWFIRGWCCSTPIRNSPRSHGACGI